MGAKEGRNRSERREEWEEYEREGTGGEIEVRQRVAIPVVYSNIKVFWSYRTIKVALVIGRS